MQLEKEEQAMAPVEQPIYEPPAVTSYTDEQLLEALGPAQTVRYGLPT